MAAGRIKSVQTNDAHWVVKGIPCAERKFCLNSGLCTYFPRINARACNCTSGYEGPRCEFSASNLDFDHSRRVDSVPTTGFNIYTYGANILTILLLCVIIFMLHRLLRRRANARKSIRRMRQSENGKLRSFEEGQVTLTSGLSERPPERRTFFSRFMSKREKELPNFSNSFTSKSVISESSTVSVKESKWNVVRTRLLTEPTVLEVESESFPVENLTASAIDSNPWHWTH